MGNGREISGSLREEKKRKENSPEKELLVGGGGCRVSTGREEEAWSPEEENGAGRVFFLGTSSRGRKKEGREPSLKS